MAREEERRRQAGEQARRMGEDRQTQRERVQKADYDRRRALQREREDGRRK